MSAQERPSDALTALSAQMRKYSDAEDDWGNVCPSRARVDEWADAIDAVLAQQGRLLEGWRDIATAPKPERGRRVVVDLWCVADDVESAKFYFGSTCSGVKDQMLWQGRVSDVYWFDGAWRPATGLRMHGLTVTPTHWKPLPSPPVSHAEKGKE